MSDTHVEPLVPHHVAYDLMVEAAQTVEGHGFADTWGNMAAPQGHHALATVNATTLLNLGHEDLSQRFRQAFGEGAYDVHVLTQGDGQPEAWYGPQGLPQISAGFERDREDFEAWHEAMMSED